MIIWGNHSSTQYPDLSHCVVGGKPAKSLVDQGWIEKDFIPTVQQRGAAVIKARGLSSAASAASAAIDHVRDWALGSHGKWVSMAVPSDGSYGIKKGIIYSYPVTCRNGTYSIVQGLEINAFSRTRLAATEQELAEIPPACASGVTPHEETLRRLAVERHRLHLEAEQAWMVRCLDAMQRLLPTPTPGSMNGVDSLHAVPPPVQAA